MAVLKRFILPDSEVYSEDILDALVGIAHSIGIHKVFSESITNTFVDIQKVQGIVKSKLANRLPKTMLKQLWSKINKNFIVFINRKKTYVNDKIEYYKLMQQIYSTIIFKKNSTIYKTVTEVFNLEKRGKDAIIEPNELRSFITDFLAIKNNSIITTDM